jgi:hypothetical protein
MESCLFTFSSLKFVLKDILNFGHRTSNNLANPPIKLYHKLTQVRITYSMFHFNMPALSRAQSHLPIENH